MNKVLVVPLAILMIFSLTGMVMSLGGFTVGFNGGGILVVNGTGHSGWDVTTWDLTSANALITIVIGIAVLVAFLGITFLGSSILSTTGQVIMLKLLGLFGLYWALSNGSGWFFNAIPVWGNVAYIMLTLMFSLGFIMDIQGGS